MLLMGVADAGHVEKEAGTAVDVGDAGAAVEEAADATQRLGAGTVLEKQIVLEKQPCLDYTVT